MCKRIGVARRLAAVASERLMGYESNHPAAILALGFVPREVERKRLSLLGNAWQLDVARFWIQCHFADLIPHANKETHHCDDPIKCHSGMNGSPLWGSLESHLKALDLPLTEVELYISAINDGRYVIDRLRDCCPCSRDGSRVWCSSGAR